MIIFIITFNIFQINFLIYFVPKIFRKKNLPEYLLIPSIILLNLPFIIHYLTVIMSIILSFFLLFTSSLIPFILIMLEIIFILSLMFLFLPSHFSFLFSLIIFNSNIIHYLIIIIFLIYLMNNQFNIFFLIFI
jgi:hypothetical protein